MKRALAIFPALLLAFSLTLPAVTGLAAGYDDVANVEAIKKRLETLRVFYTDDHPSIQRLLRVLKKAEALEAQRKQQDKAEALLHAFPPAPQGWRTAWDQDQDSEPRLESLSPHVSAAKHYENLDGGEVSIEAFTDPSAVESLAQRLNHPPPAAGGPAGKLTNLRGHKALLIKTGYRQAELLVLVNNKILLRVSAQRVDDAAVVVREFAAKVDLQRIGWLAR